MIECWIDRKKCTGCGACCDICPNNAIYMEKDKEGFYYPRVTRECTNCGLCKYVCEARSRQSKHGISKAYAAYSKNDVTRFTSTSGGVFFELAKAILEKGGIVAGAQFDADYEVKHVVVDKVADVDKLKQSKYLQSNSNNIYSQLREKLLDNDELFVLFAGTPCQVAALKAYLGKEYKHLFLVEFICHGVNSPLVYKKWLQELEMKKGHKVVKVWFKYKDRGWTASPKCTKIQFDNGDSIIQRGRDNYYMEGFVKYDFYTRSCCSECDFKGTSRMADITLADFWDWPTAYSDDKGTSLVLINSAKALTIWEMLYEKVISEEVSWERYVKGNRILNSSIKENRYRTLFFLLLQRVGFEKAYLITKTWDDVAAKINHILYKVCGRK